MKKIIVFVLLLVVMKSVAQLNPIDLTCEYMNNPSVIDEVHPRLSWINIALNKEKGQFQTAYQIRVATTTVKLNLPDIWDSGIMQSEESNRIHYNGTPLKSSTTYYWQVRVWDKNNKVSAWSEIAKWHVGILEKNEWKAEWIGAPWQGEEPIPKPIGGPQERTKIMPPPAPLLRKTFQISKPIKQAVVYTTGLGYFEFYVNGKKASSDLLVPNQTNYDVRPQLPDASISLPDQFKEYHIMYLAYDITNNLKIGKNAIGAILGNGFYNAPKFWTASYGTPRYLAQLHIIYTDGSEETIVSDKTWKVAKSAIISDLVYDGEIYDARQEQPDWCIASLDDTEWENAINRRTPYGKLVAHTAPTDKVMEILQPIKIQKLPNGNFKVDFAEEISGWVRLKNISAPSGHQIKITFNGNQYSGENTYIFNGKKSQNYVPRFNWFVFSSIEISNWFGILKPENIQAEAVNTDIKKSSIFETSNPLFNKINKIWQRSQLDNMHGGIASDCPHRERSAYTGDAQVACQTVMANFEVKVFYKKWIRDILSSQIPETGYVPNGSPWQPGCGGGVAWGAAIQIIPWEFYQHYGDKEVLLESYEGMKGYMKYMKTWVDMDGIMYSQRTGKDGNPLKWWNLGEWAGVDHQLPPDALVHTFYYWLCADITANTAQILGNTDDYIFFKTIANDTRKAFIKKFYNAEKGTFGKNGANIFALKMGLEKAQYESVIKAVKTDIAGNDGHFDTGIFGTRYFFEVLADNGLQDLAYAAMNKTTVPSFGHWVSIGSTTTREQWDDSGSHNHPMFGGGLNWFYRNLAGMKTDEQTPGYKKIIFRPMPLSDLKQVNYFTETVFGKAGIEWKQNNGFEMHLEIPVGSTAIVYFPIKDQSKITENGKDIQSLNYVKNIKSITDYRTFEIGSGVYDFKL